MLTYLKAENIKIRHTAIPRLALFAPLATILLSFFLACDFFMVDNYNWWYSMILPLYITIISGMLMQKDGKMGNRAVISLPIDLKKIWIAKIMIGVELLFISCGVIFMGSVLFPVVRHVIGGTVEYGIPVTNAFLATIVLVITFAWQIPFCMVLNEKLGMFVTLIINTGLNVTAGILAATETFWWVFPHSYGARLMIPILNILPNGLIAEDGSETFSPMLLSWNVLIPGILISIILFLGLTWISARAYSNREAC